MEPPVRYRFGVFVLSPRRRVLLRDGRPVPLIPKYLDVLHVLVERRDGAVSKAEIFDAVWRDVIVTDGALTQAVRTLRRALDDDPRAPRFIRTVSRHGYQFVAVDVVEEPDRGDGASDSVAAEPAPAASSPAVEDAVERLMASAAGGSADADAAARDAAASLHALDTSAAVTAVRGRPDHARALAYLRDARWSEPAAGPVPLAGDPEAARTALALVRLRLADARPLIADRARSGLWMGARVGAAAGAAGGAVLVLSPDAAARVDGMVALAAIGAVAGAAGVAAVTSAVAAAALVLRSQRIAGVLAAAATAGASAGGAAQLIVAALLGGLFAMQSAAIPGAVEGLVLAAGVAAGYLASTPGTTGGTLPAPAGVGRLIVLTTMAAAGAAVGVALGAAARPLVGGMVHAIARAAGDAPLALGPLARILGEPTFGPLTQRLLAAFEGAMFGVAVGLALTRRPSRHDLTERSPAAQAPLTTR